MLKQRIRCLAVDDEPPALDVIVHHIQAVPSLELVGTSPHAIEAMTMLSTKAVDLLFLDIQMPQLLGTDFVRTLRNAPKLIFTTAHREFAIEGYELDAVDYLLKPISFERFLKAVNKVIDQAPVTTIAAPETPRKDGYLYFRTNRKTMKVAVQDILYFESIGDYIKVVANNKTIVTKQAISALEEELAHYSFVRIHRSFIVAMDKIDSYSKEIIEVNRQQLPVSRMYRLEVERRLK